MKFIYFVFATVSLLLPPSPQENLRKAHHAWNMLAEDWTRRARQVGVDKTINFDITATKPHDITSRLTLREPTQEWMYEQVVMLSNFVAKETMKTSWTSRDLITQITAIPAAEVYIFTIKTSTCRKALGISDIKNRSKFILANGQYQRLWIGMKVNEKW